MLINKTQTARLFGVTPRTIDNWVNDEDHPLVLSDKSKAYRPRFDYELVKALLPIYRKVTFTVMPQEGPEPAIASRSKEFEEAI